MLIVAEELRKEEESAIDHSNSHSHSHLSIVKVILMKQQHVICSHVLQTHLQLMEDGAFGHPGHLAMLYVEMELKQEAESAINRPPLMEGHFVEDLLMKKQDVTWTMNDVDRTQCAQWKTTRRCAIASRASWAPRPTADQSAPRTAIVQATRPVSGKRCLISCLQAQSFSVY